MEIMTAHAKLSASGAHRWANCPGSVIAEAPYPDTSSSFAQRGTLAHEIAEECLRTEASADAFMDREGVDLELVEGIQFYLDYVRNTVKQMDGELFIEQRVEFSDWVPEGFGTADAIILTPKILDVQDLKMGKGVRVFANNNPQPILYGLGVLQEFEFLGLADVIEIVRLTIVQPLLDHVDVVEYTVEELRDHGAALSVAASKAILPDAPRVAGEKQCRFCKAAANCKALADFNLDLAAGEFSQWEKNIELRDPDEIDLTMLCKILDNSSGFTRWLTQIKERAEDEIQNGSSDFGYKMVAGRTSRKWLDEDAAERALKRALGAANAFSKKLLTPPAAEKFLGKDHTIMDKHVVKAEGAPTLVPSADKRTAIDYSPVDPEDDFASIS